MSRRFHVIEWASATVIAGSVAFIVFGPSPTPAPPAAPAALAPSMRIEPADDGRALARIDDAVVRATCDEVGLPVPPPLDGCDPLPVRIILEEIDRWSADLSIDALAAIGRLYQAIEQHEPALACFAALTQLAPDDPLWPYFAGTEAQALGRGDLAVSMLRRAASVDPGYFTTHARLGLLHVERGELDAAEASYRRCLELVPQMSLPHVGLGRVALARGENTVAVEHLERAVTTTTNDYMAYRLFSRALAGAGRPADAATASVRAEALPHYEGWLVFDERLQQSHAMARTQRFLENQLRRARTSGDHTRTIEIAKRMLQRRPRDANTLGVLAGAHIQLNEMNEADAAITRALEVKPDAVPMLCMRAQLAALRGDFDTFYRVLDEAEAVDDTFAPIYELRGRILFMQGRLDEAVAEIERTIELDPTPNDRWLMLAAMLEQSQRPAEAAATLETLLERDPANTPARDRLAALRASMAAPEGPPGR